MLDGLSDELFESTGDAALLKAMLEDVRRLVVCESPTGDAAAIGRSLAVVADLGTRLLGEPPVRGERDGLGYLRWSFGTGTPQILLLAHHDTVWPIGSWGAKPWKVVDGHATGPGCFDMKAGLVQLMHAVSMLNDPSGVTLLVTSDEEIGSPRSRALIAELAAQVGVVLVGEPSGPGGALKTQRSGVAQYTVTVTGRRAHAGLEPERGINATVELAHQIHAIAGLHRTIDSATITPTVLSAGETVNTVPDVGTLAVDVRAATTTAMRTVEAGLQALTPVLDGARVEVAESFSSPPLERTASAALFALAQSVAEDLELEPLTEIAVGGGSDGNIAAATGALVLDGLGAVGGNAHAEGEWIDVAALVPRAELVAGIIASVQAGRLGGEARHEHD